MRTSVVMFLIPPTLEEMVESKKFRQDLYYRLQVYPICIPPLRERMEDIPYLIQLFIDKYREKNEEQIRFSSEVVNLLYKYNWPGNVRELFNLLERLSIICPNGEVLVEHLPQEFYKKFTYHVGGSFQERVELFEYQALKETLLLYKTTRKAAEALQMSQPTFVRKLKQYQKKYDGQLKVVNELME